MTVDRLPSEIGLLAPGTALRDGLDRIVNGRTGALIVMGTNPVLESISTGGFAFDVPFTATRLRELAKMDGAIVLGPALDRIVAAAVHLSPASILETAETGTRHRTAQRVTQETGLPVVTVSGSMGTISLFSGERRHVIPRPGELLNRASQAIGAIGVHRQRLLSSLERLTALEIHDSVTVRDLAHVAQRFEATNRLADEASTYITALGVDGRLASLQLRDLIDDLTPLASLLQRDYADPHCDALLFAGLNRLDDHELFDIVLVGRALGFGPRSHLDSPLRAKGYRQLATIPRLPQGVSARLVERFGDLAGLFAASPTDLLQIDGVTAAVASQIRDGLAHITERALSV